MEKKDKFAEKHLKSTVIFATILATFAASLISYFSIVLASSFGQEVANYTANNAWIMALMQVMVVFLWIFAGFVTGGSIVYVIILMRAAYKDTFRK